MTALVMLFSLMLGAVLQAVSPMWALLGQVKLPVLFAVVVYYALTRERRLFLPAGLSAGIFQDALGQSPLGYSAFAFIAVGWLVHRYRDQVFDQDWPTQMLVGGVGYATVNGLLVLLLGSSGYIEPSPGWVALKCMGSLLLGMLVVPLVFRMIAGLDRLVGNVERSAEA